MNELKSYNKELHEKAATIAKKFMFDGMAITSKGRPLDVTWFESTLQGLQAIIPFKIEWLNEACMGLGGGFSGQGEICGHVSAGVIAIGLDVLNTSKEKGRDTVLMRVKIQTETRRFCEAFKKEYGGISCRDLVGVDNLTDRKLAEDALKKGGFKHCFDSQRWVAMFPLPSERDPEPEPSLDEIRTVLSGGVSPEELLSMTSGGSKKS